MPDEWFIPSCGAVFKLFSANNDKCNAGFSRMRVIKVTLYRLLVKFCRTILFVVYPVYDFACDNQIRKFVIFEH